MFGPANYSVLMVDDNAAMREAIARSLTRRGCSVTTAVSGVAGFEALRTQPFDVIISDLNMPERGGLWLWRQAVALRPELRGRFVIVASEPFPEPRSMSLLLESERFLLKPITLDLLLRRSTSTGTCSARRSAPLRRSGFSRRFLCSRAMDSPICSQFTFNAASMKLSVLVSTHSGVTASTRIVPMRSVLVVTTRPLVADGLMSRATAMPRRGS